MNKVLVIGIAGGSGSGKSTVALSLYKKHSEEIAVLHIDDYFKKKEQVPLLEGFTNWDHPDSIDFEKFFNDILSLKNGKKIKIFTKSEIYNPNYSHTLKNKIEYEIEPKSIIIIEGYLALWDEKIRELMDYKIYLDIPIEESTKRRSENKFALNQEYFLKVLTPMHKKYVEQTKKYADIILDVSDKNTNDVYDFLEKKIFKQK